MSVPKRRQTSSRRDRRRKHNEAVSVPKTVVCSSCGTKTVSHRACRECGAYKGRTVVSKEKKD